MRKLNPFGVYLVLDAGRVLASTLIFTVLTIYYVTVVGLNPLQLVLVGTLLEATILLLEVPTGVVADTFSRRLSVIIGVFVMGLAFLLEGFVVVFAGVLLAEAIRGVGETFLSGATDAWLADEVGEERVGAVYLRATQIGQIVGLLATVASVGLASIQLNLPILVGGGIYLALGFFLLLAMPERGFAPAERGERSPWQNLGGTLLEGARVVRGQPVLLMLLGVGLFAGAASEGFDRLWEAHLLTNFRFPALGNLGPVAWFGIISITSQLTGLLVIQLTKRRIDAATGRPSTAARALLWLEGLSIMSVIVFGLAGSFSLALVAILVKDAIGVISRPIYGAWLVQQIDPKVRATVLSMSSLTNAFGQTVGGPGVGAIGTFGSLRAALVVAGLLLSPALALYAKATGSRIPAETVTGLEATEIH